MRSNALANVEVSQRDALARWAKANPSLVRLIAVMCLSLVVGAVTVPFLLACRSVFVEFRESSYVSLPVGAGDTSTILQLQSLLRSQDVATCGLSAPNLRVYRRILLQWVSSRTDMLIAVNPRYSNATFGIQSVKAEQSLLCFNSTDAMNRQRYLSVTATYYDFVSSRNVTRVLDGVDAICFQHHVDVLDGVWPCSGDGVRLPRHLNQHSEL